MKEEVTMKALVLEKPSVLVMKDAEKPAPGPDEVLIRVKACAICGSDVHGLDDSSGRRHPPIVMGHEASGQVEAVGPAVGGFAAGDRVVFNSTLSCGVCHFCVRGLQNMCTSGKVYGVSSDAYRLQGAMAEYIVVPQRILYHLPPTVSYEQAAMVEPLSIALHAVNLVDIRVGDSAVVFGAGTIGIMLIKLLKLSSCSTIIAVDIDESKLELAKASGAAHCFSPAKGDLQQRVLEVTDGLGATHAYEAVGIPATTRMGIDCLRRTGSFVLLGNLTPNIELPVQKVVLKELKLVGSYCFSAEAETSLRLLADGSVKVDDLISAVVPLEKGAEMFKRLKGGEKGLRKVVLVP
jgi:L-iditol 2-dehydrogenase